MVVVEGAQGRLDVRRGLPSPLSFDRHIFRLFAGAGVGHATATGFLLGLVAALEGRGRLRPGSGGRRCRGVQVFVNVEVVLGLVPLIFLRDIRIVNVRAQARQGEVKGVRARLRLPLLR